MGLFFPFGLRFESKRVTKTTRTRWLLATRWWLAWRRARRQLRSRRPLPRQVQGRMHQTQQGRPRPCPRGGWLLSLREACHGVAEDLKGQALLEVPQEAHRIPHQGEEEA